MSPDKGGHRAIDVAVAAGLPLKIAGKKREPAEQAYFDEFVAPAPLATRSSTSARSRTSEKVELLQNARATLFPIEWEEPFGLVMIESMACGTPVIATRFGAVPEVIEDGRSGIIVDDYRQMAAALEDGGPARPAGARPLRGGALLARADGRRLRGCLTAIRIEPQSASLASRDRRRSTAALAGGRVPGRVRARGRGPHRRGRPLPGDVVDAAVRRAVADRAAPARLRGAGGAARATAPSTNCESRRKEAA